jgi:hypothetical protein
MEISPVDQMMSIYLPTGSGLQTGGLADIDLFPMSSFPFPERTTLRQDQIDFCVSRFKAFIPQLVRQNRSPFVHPDSYKHTPPVIYQDLLGISAMYCQKSPQNQTILFSILDSRIASLVEFSKSSSWSITDYLLGVQVLIMYQIIRLFDGDARQQANGERHLGLLETWTLQLHLTTNTFDNYCQNKSSYQGWIFAESARRTVLISSLVHAMYSLLKDGVCNSVPMMAKFPVSIDGTLWNTSEEFWGQTTVGFEGGLSTYGDFVTQWNDGQAVYTDIYETILLGACRHNLRRPPLMIV